MRAILALFFLSASLVAQSALEKAATLARQHKFAEAKAALIGISEPSEIAPRIAFHRLKAAIASGLGDAPAAAREMRDALALTPNDPPILLATAISEMQAGLLLDAFQHAQAAASLIPDNESYQLALATISIRSQDFSRAIKALQQVLPRFPHSGRLRTLQGIAEYAVGETSDAIDALESAITVEPNLDSAYRCLSRIVLQSAAVPSVKVAAILCHWDELTCAALHLRLAHAESDTKAQAKAMSALERAPGTNSMAHCELARGYEWSSRLADARSQMELCIRYDPSPQNHYRLSMIYKRLGMNEQANAELQARTRQLEHMSEETAAGLDALHAYGTPSK